MSRRKRRQTCRLNLTQIKRTALREAFKAAGAKELPARRAATILTLNKGDFMGRWALAMKELPEMDVNVFAGIVRDCQAGA